MTVFPALLHITTHLSYLCATFHTASAGAVRSRTYPPVCALYNRTRPSFPPVTSQCLSSCKAVTLESCAAIHLFVFSSDQEALVEGGSVNAMTRPSEPPVASVEPVSCSWQTSAVWPCSKAIHCLLGRISDEGITNNQKIQTHQQDSKHGRWCPVPLRQYTRHHMQLNISGGDDP